MKTLKKYIKYLQNPKLLFLILLQRLFARVIRFIPDKMFLKIYYRLKTGKKLNLENPKTFNEKLQWLKIYDRKPEYTQMVDKYEVKKYVAKKIGEKYIIPLYGVWDSFEEINFDELPNKFVLKCTHAGGTVICNDKDSLDLMSREGVKLSMRSAKKMLSKQLKQNYFYSGRTWAYKNVKPRIIAEQYIEDSNEKILQDYKIFTFNGKPKLIQVHFSKDENHKANFYSTDWVFQDFCLKEPNDKNHYIEKPKYLEDMLNFAEVLSQGTYHLRVDFYYPNNKLYFGELTFHNWSGTGKFTPESYDELLGSWINLPKLQENE
ncbi:MAG: glycosyl transferase [Bacteroidales bacterium]|jgi:hypothetical protein|nr:glycosyl transferase [Bacteroidales bacterium]